MGLQLSNRGAVAKLELDKGARACRLHQFNVHLNRCHAWSLGSFALNMLRANAQKNGSANTLLQMAKA